ncbi:MAG: hypothetical protein ACM3O9_03815 [Methylocystaceae bacterium]
MWRWHDRFEIAVRRLAVLLVLILVLVQGAMLNDDVRYRLSIGEQFEGRPVTEQSSRTIQAASDSVTTGEEMVSPWAEVELEMLHFSSLPRAMVLVNGQWAGSFTEPKLRLRVMGSDDIEIETSSYDFPVQFRINKASVNLVQPCIGDIYKSNHGRIFVGKVMVK